VIRGVLRLSPLLTRVRTSTERMSLAVDSISFSHICTPVSASELLQSDAGQIIPRVSDLAQHHSASGGRSLVAIKRIVLFRARPQSIELHAAALLLVRLSIQVQLCRSTPDREGMQLTMRAGLGVACTSYVRVTSTPAARSRTAPREFRDTRSEFG
jgi:hypothetical protein